MKRLLPEPIIAESINQSAAVFTGAAMELAQKTMADVIGRKLSTDESYAFRITFFRGLAKRLSDEAQRLEMEQLVR